MPENLLYYGDNLDVLRRDIGDESVDLVYLDPPFNSNQEYNLLFAERDGTRAAAQLKAFGDTWRWDQSSVRTYQDVVERGPEKVAQTLRAFRTFLGDNDMMAYLAMMAPRLIELRRVLKSTGSLYLHCDPTASHYLKLLLDAVFGPENFRNEIIWKRTSAHSSARRYGPVHDTLMFYSKTDEYTWNRVFQPYDETYVATFFEQRDADGRQWKRMDLTGAGVRNGATGDVWRGIDVTAKGRHWAYPPAVLEQLDAAGKVHWPRAAGGMPRLKQFLDEMPGVPLQDIWTDVAPLHNLAAERLGYQTQKPVALVERIIQASCPDNGTVLDPFCGCGTTVSAAQKLGRRWIGIDITILAINLVRRRIRSEWGRDVIIKEDGIPTTIQEAEALAELERHQFQWWALDMVGAVGSDRRRGPDRGIDGRLFFHDDDAKAASKQIIFSVKSGDVSVSDIRELIGVIQREAAEIGVLLTLREPTRPMRREAASAGFYHSAWREHPRIQILTIAELFAGQRVDYPEAGRNVTFKDAPRRPRKVAEPLQLPLETDPAAIRAEQEREAAERRQRALSVPSTRVRTRHEGKTGITVSRASQGTASSRAIRKKKGTRKS